MQKHAAIKPQEHSKLELPALNGIDKPVNEHDKRGR